ncbi:zinc ABC transporter substrate-binding protein [Aquimarina sp. MMG015]|uniref:metal ABC transporter solute-binding protein, Zn/Mn family n=1 Tax=unclassified Aquimarina TaxID=2627091 RepID=UPI000E521B1E|nr:MULTISPECIES: zinc ABC transporter substrate-binding protein [unclassified Aquimarina]AXT56112.1 manganese transporter [Aquimarina sp. AD1]MBQ4803794.1 zinc ABC transporter substrate-binding protein [Aquimarina sp. MMG015]RKN09518.1 manganese transporter [Aquimarina sp. AD1]
MIKKTAIFLALTITLFSCKKEEKKVNQKLNVVTTTTMITDLVKNIGGDLITVEGLMGSGVDPHLYKASEGDVTKLVNADVIFYNGLHLEGKLVEVFEKMGSQNIKTIAVGEVLDKSILIGSDYFASNYDPHIWFNVNNWKQVTLFTIEKLKELDPKNAEVFETNGKSYLKKLNVLESNIKTTIETLPKDKRILVTAHDAFSYFGKEYAFNVVGLQGLSTATEAGVQDVQKLAAFIIENQVKAIFVETSVPKRTIEALQAAVKSKDHEVIIGGTLYSDALGNPGTIEGTYIGMFEYNVTTIVNALK